MFAISPSQLTRGPESQQFDISSSIKMHKSKHSRPAGPSNQENGEHPSITGWTNENSLNASGVAQGTNTDNNQALGSNRANDVNPKASPEKPKEEIQPQSRKTWLEGTKDRPYEASLRSYPKPNNFPRSPKTSSMNRTGGFSSFQRSTDFSINQLHQAYKPMEFVSSFPCSPEAQPLQKRDDSQNNNTLQATQTLGTNESSEISASMQDLRIFQVQNFARTASNKFERRAGTAFKTRQVEPLNMPITVLGLSKTMKVEDPKRHKNLRLSKALSFWSQVIVPQTISNVSATEPSEMSNIMARTHTGISSTKFLTFGGSKQDGNNEQRNVIPLPHFRTTMKVKRPLEEDSMGTELKCAKSKQETLRLKMTSQVSLYTKDWESIQPKKKTTRDEQKSEGKQRPFVEVYVREQKSLDKSSDKQKRMSHKSEERYTVENSSSVRQDKLYKKVIQRINKVIVKSPSGNREISLEKGQETLTPKVIYGAQFFNIEAKIGIDGRGLSRQERGSKAESVSVEPLKWKGDGKTDRKKTTIKNFRLFEATPKVE